MKLSIDLNKKYIICQFRGTLKKTDLLGQNEQILVRNAILDEGYLEEFYLDLYNTEQVYIDTNQEFQKPCIYIEEYFDGEKEVINKQILTW